MDTNRGVCMRADAEANREKLLDAAGDVFAHRGADAPLALIAERAGVGKGTLYRHFADRDAVILGLGARLRERYVAIAVAAASAPSGWDAIVAYIDGVAGMYVDMPWLVAVRARVRELAPWDRSDERAVVAVIERAWEEGSLRRDIEPTDLAFVPSLLSGLVDLPEPVRSTVIARQRDIILDGLRPEDAERPSLAGEPLDIELFREHVYSAAG